MEIVAVGFSRPDAFPVIQVTMLKLGRKIQIYIISNFFQIMQQTLYGCTIFIQRIHSMQLHPLFQEVLKV